MYVEDRWSGESCLSHTDDRQTIAGLKPVRTYLRLISWSVRVLYLLLVIVISLVWRNSSEVDSWWKPTYLSRRYTTWPYTSKPNIGHGVLRKVVSIYIMRIFLHFFFWNPISSWISRCHAGLIMLMAWRNDAFSLSMAVSTRWWITAWFLITAPVIFWDAGYCFMRYVFLHQINDLN